MSAHIDPILPATVRFIGPWSDEDRAQVIMTLVPLIPALTVPWLLTYNRETLDLGKRGRLAEDYSAAVERDDQVQIVIDRFWDLGMFCRQLAAHVRAQSAGLAAPAAKPIRRSPLEIGTWYTKKAFEKQYQLSRWPHVVVINGGQRLVRVRPYALQNLLRTHKDAYFQLQWNDQPHQRQQKSQVEGRRSRERFELIPVTDARWTTVKLRICYALTPERDTEIVLYDGYGLPEIDRWWEKVTSLGIALPLPAEAQTTPDLSRDIAA